MDARGPFNTGQSRVKELTSLGTKLCVNNRRIQRSDLCKRDYLIGMICIWYVVNNVCMTRDMWWVYYIRGNQEIANNIVSRVY